MSCAPHAVNMSEWVSRMLTVPAIFKSFTFFKTLLKQFPLAHMCIVFTCCNHSYGQCSGTFPTSVRAEARNTGKGSNADSPADRLSDDTLTKDRFTGVWGRLQVQNRQRKTQENLHEQKQEQKQKNWQGTKGVKYYIMGKDWGNWV